MPQVTVLIPTPLRKFTGDADTLTLDGGTDIASLMTAITTAHPGLGKPLLDESGVPRRFVNLYVNGEDIRFLDNTATVLKDGDEVSIVPAIAGGASGTEVYNLTFHRDMFSRPILHSLGKKFRVVVTIRRAVLNEEAGWAEVSFGGPAEEIGRAIADLQTSGVNVTGPLTEIIEPDLETRVPVGVGRGT